MTAQDDLDALNLFIANLDRDRERIANEGARWWAEYAPTWVRAVVTTTPEVEKTQTVEQLRTIRDDSAEYISALTPMIRSGLNALMKDQVEGQQSESYPGTMSESHMRQIIDVFNEPFSGLSAQLKEHGYHRGTPRTINSDFKAGRSEFSNDFESTVKTWGQNMDELMNLSRTYKAAAKAESETAAANRWDSL